MICPRGSLSQDTVLGNNQRTTLHWRLEIHVGRVSEAWNVALPTLIGLPEARNSRRPFWGR